MPTRSTAAGLGMMLLGTLAAAADDNTIYTATYIEVGPVLAKVGSAALRNYREAARGDAKSLDVFQRIDRANQFVALAAWASKEAHDRHLAGDASNKLSEKLEQKLDKVNPQLKDALKGLFNR